MTISRNTCDNVIIWHARLWHIGQERINRLVKENLLGQLTKIDMLTWKYCLVDKKKKPFKKKKNQSWNTIAINPLWHLWSHKC